MAKAAPNKASSLRQRLLGHIAHWRPVLGLESWAITVRFDEPKLVGYCKANPRYLTATLGFNLARVRKEYPRPIDEEEIALHELVHAVAPRESERAVSQLTYALLRVAGRTL